MIALRARRQLVTATVFAAAGAAVEAHHRAGVDGVGEVLSGGAQGAGGDQAGVGQGGVLVGGCRRQAGHRESWAAGSAGVVCRVRALTVSGVAPRRVAVRAGSGPAARVGRGRSPPTATADPSGPRPQPPSEGPAPAVVIDIAEAHIAPRQHVSDQYPPALTSPSGARAGRVSRVSGACRCGPRPWQADRDRNETEPRAPSCKTAVPSPHAVHSVRCTAENGHSRSIPQTRPRSLMHCLLC